tara:strand:- start:193 stop:1152 length:960 start_codon:yes stop_codon:yes gene_type:complete
LSKLNILNNNDKSSGFETFDDCSIYQINDKQSIIQTVDFFTPIVDDPYTFGQIAATNSLSDIYAMGGIPLFALNIVGFPSDKLDIDILASILQGGIDKCSEAKIKILGGHSIKDDVPKYGLAVTGIIDNDKIVRNNKAAINDDIILTKPIGSGIISTAIKRDLVDNKTYKAVIKIMNNLNDKSSKLMRKYNISACTDVTGFGLLGHLNEVCNGSNLSSNIKYNKVPTIINTEKFAKDDIIPGGTKNNLNFLKKDIYFNSSLELFQKMILADAQTSGGLLIACNKSDSQQLLNDLNSISDYQSSIIGEFIAKKDFNIYCN